jgi:hypothetical protein
MRVTGRPISYVATVVGGLLTVTVPAASFARYLKQVRITGPAGSSFNLYLGSVAQAPFDTTTRGDSNFEDYGNTVMIPPGYSIIGQWSSGVGSASATFTMDRDV